MPEISQKKTLSTKRDETKIRILEATLNLMVKYGFKGTTTKKIAEAAGINEVTIFRHFKNKKAIFRGILKNARYLSRSSLFEKFFNGDFSSIEELFDKFSEMAFKSFLLNKDLFLLFLKEIGSEDSEFYRLHIEMMTNLINTFNKKLEKLNKKEKIKLIGRLIYLSCFYISCNILVRNERKKYFQT